MIDITEPSPEILLELSIMLQKGGVAAVKDAEQYMRKKDPGSLKKKDIQAAFIRRLSGYVTEGLIHLTVEKVKSTEEFQKSQKDSSSPYIVVLEKHQRGTPFLPERSHDTRLHDTARDVNRGRTVRIPYSPGHPGGVFQTIRFSASSQIRFCTVRSYVSAEDRPGSLLSSKYFPDTATISGELAR